METWASLVAWSVKSLAAKQEATCKTGGTLSIPGSERSPGEGNRSPLQYSCLGNPMERGVWRATVHRVARVGHDWATKCPGIRSQWFWSEGGPGDCASGWHLKWQQSFGDSAFYLCSLLAFYNHRYVWIDFWTSQKWNHTTCVFLFSVFFFKGHS